MKHWTGAPYLVHNPALVSREELYSTHADTVEAVITAVCRRHRLPADQAEELGSQIRLKLIADDCAVLRQFQGRSSMRTFLVTVAERVLLDWRTREWGKWRPCQEAKRLGALAIDLDRLLSRDGMSYEEAAELLITRGRATSRAELDAIRPKLTQRTGRWMVSGEVLEHMPAQTGAADEHVRTAEIETQVLKASRALSDAVKNLPPEDQIILRLRFQDGFTVARVAEFLGVEQKPLYRRFERLFAQLRDVLAKVGVTESDLATIFGAPAVELAPVLDSVDVGIAARGPSTRISPGGRHA
jgi:RNA polymerase sigma factor (sigma-70 family)